MNYEDYVREQVEPISKRNWKIVQELKNLGIINLDTRILTRFWRDFVKYKERRKTEIPFLLSQLKEYQCPKIFNSCLGSGPTTIGLVKAGIRNVISNEIDDDFLRLAEQETKKYGVRLCVTRYDWRELNKQLFEKFDAVLNLGNSLTYLFKPNDQSKSLNNFWKTLKFGGKLIIDERNYAELFLKGNGSNYKYTGKVVYCGVDKVYAHPFYISDDQNMVIMEYIHKKNGAKLHLVLYPWKKGELKEKLTKAGFKKIKVYGDYQEQFDPKDPEFFTYVCRKI